MVNEDENLEGKVRRVPIRVRPEHELPRNEAYGEPLGRVEQPRRFGRFRDTLGSGFQAIGDLTIGSWASKIRARGEANEAARNLEELTRDNLRLTRRRLNRFEDVEQLTAAVNAHEQTFEQLDQGLKAQILATFNTYKTAQERAETSALAELRQEHPNMYHGGMAAAKGLGAIAGMEIIKFFTPGMIDRIISIPELYVASIAATTSLRQIPNRALKIILSTGVPLAGGMLSYSTAAGFVGEAVSKLHGATAITIKNMMYKGYLLVFGLLAKNSLNTALERPEMVQGRTVMVRPLDRYRAADAGLDTLIRYVGTDILVEGSAQMIGLPLGIYQPAGHIAAGIASSSYVNKSDKLTGPMKFGLRLAIPLVAGYHAVEGVGQGLVNGSETLKEYAARAIKDYAARGEKPSAFTQNLLVNVAPMLKSTGEYVRDYGSWISGLLGIGYVLVRDSLRNIGVGFSRRPAGR